MGNTFVECCASKLERQIEFLETSGLEAARSGTLTKLKAKLKGLHSTSPLLAFGSCSIAKRMPKLGKTPFNVMIV